MGLQNNGALVTGGSKGGSPEDVRSLIAEGARVVNMNRSKAEGRWLKADDDVASKEYVVVQVDLKNVAACQNAASDSGSTNELAKVRRGP